MSPIAEAEGPPVNAVPKVPIHFIPATGGETFALGALSIRIMEDGSNTGKIIFRNLAYRIFGFLVVCAKK